MSDYENARLILALEVEPGTDTDALADLVTQMLEAEPGVLAAWREWR